MRTTNWNDTRNFEARFALVLVAACGVSAIGCGPADEPAAQPAALPGSLVTWAGTGAQGHDDGSHPRMDSWLNQPIELAFASDGTALIVDWNNHCVRRVDKDGKLADVIGTPFPGDWPCLDPTTASLCEVPLSGSVPGAELPLNHPTDVVIAEDGSFDLAAWHNHKVEHYDASTEAVTVVSGQQKPGPDGDNGPASAARLNFPSSLVRQSDGGLLISDERNNRVRRIAPDGDRTITTVVGVLPPAMGTNPGVTDDGVPATQALLALTTADKLSGADNPPPGGAIALGDDGTLYIADTFHHCIRSVAPGADGVVGSGPPEEETITTVAGTCGTSGYSGDGGAAREALLNQPFDLEIGPDDGALYIADVENHAIRRVDLDSGTIRTIAGTGHPGYSGENLPATKSKLREPYGLAFDAKGALFIVDTGNNRIREIAR